eukprot:TRINITY_DN48247_c0_g1_i1.p1 TRINITY_DN48247_c0_g1~~TRINITY_DN48247_c0_g1_i1.p1  ORF type:complete len:716 (-),score=50.87 TRINITY_DN48247_c0_g1_i1:124-2271(-)
MHRRLWRGEYSAALCDWPSSCALFGSVPVTRRLRAARARAVQSFHASPASRSALFQIVINTHSHVAHAVRPHHHGVRLCRRPGCETSFFVDAPPSPPCPSLRHARAMLAFSVPIAVPRVSPSPRAHHRHRSPARARTISPSRAPPRRVRPALPHLPRKSHTSCSPSSCTPPSPQPPTPSLADQLTTLALSRGALGRGVRATLRAFHRRASALYPQLHDYSAPVYLEIGPAYVLASASPFREPVTRYAVEQCAWPKLRALCAWSEETAAAARARGAVLRPLPPGLRFGRHVFIDPAALSALLHTAASFTPSEPQEHGKPHSHLEAVLHLPRMPLPGVRTVAARCPRRASHAHRDANPSLILWMNDDGRSGGALCPVCRQHNKFLTWRVQYLPDGVAALYTPHSRAPAPRRAHTAAVAVCKFKSKSVNLSTCSNTKRPQRNSSPVGACVMAPNKVPHVGHVISMAYVTASLRTYDTSVATPDGEHIRLRTAGTKARQSCPVQLLLWSDRRSKGPLVAQRVEEVAWYARQIADTSLQSEQWLPTPLVSVSAMRPSSWRDVNASNERSVSVPAGWEPTAQKWILFDIDDLQGLAHCVPEVASKLVLVARRNPELSGRCLVVHTGPRGVHLWAELREVREQPKEWFRKEVVRVWYAELGYRLLNACHRAGTTGGLVDMSSCAAGRFARRPGWRLLKDGSLFRSRVVMHVPGSVKNRKPRI